MTPEEFHAKWKLSTLGERQAAQSHFNDLCELLDQPKPTDPDSYCFEKGAEKTSGRRGFCDVWKRGHFAWEYKGRGADLREALTQLQQYTLALENPPLLVVCDIDRYLIVTNWTNTVTRYIELRTEHLVTDPAARETLRRVLAEPDLLQPKLTRQQITEEAAGRLAAIAQDLRAAGHEPHAVAHLLIRLVFCMFAQNVDLLPSRMLSETLRTASRLPGRSAEVIRQLFAAMRDRDGLFGPFPVPWFDGGLFDSDEVLPLSEAQLKKLIDAADRDWSEIDPSIMGTLFERGLNPEKRGQLGKFYTDRDKIMLIIEPVIARPLTREWDDIKERLTAAVGGNGKARREAETLYTAYLDKLRRFRVLDPACGSGNFLNLALQTLKDLEWKAILEAGQLGLHSEFPQVGPEQVLGIEIDEYACELARASVWIADIQWHRRQGFQIKRQPILRPLNTIQQRDALLNEDGSEAEWPEADVIVGNPPFLGGKLLREGLGDPTVDRLFRAYAGQVSPEGDLVCYWFAKADAAVRAGRVMRAGLVATNSIRGGANRKVVDRLRDRLTIYEAWDDEPWSQEGAAVRVAIVCFSLPGDLSTDHVHLDGKPVREIYSDLTARNGEEAFDLTKAKRLTENADVAFMGDTKGGAFDISGDLARAWLRAPRNPNGRPNSDVLRPWANGLDISRRPRDMWIVDYGWEVLEADAALYELPFAYSQSRIRDQRMSRQARGYAKHWWRHERPRPEMWRSLANRDSYFVTPTVAKHRIFAILPRVVCPDHQLIVIARDDAVTFGILHSRPHELWSLRLGTWLGVGNDPRYTPSTTFETFPFPEGLTPNLRAASYADDPRAQRIAAAAKLLNERREAWLNPPDLIVRTPEVVPGFPDRLLPMDEAAAKELKKRTLTNLYNQRPAWLDHLHRELDATVAAAYGWPEGMDDEEILRRLFLLNQERAAAGR